MKTPEEIKKGLETCIVDKNCRGCPYNNGKCGMQLEIDALAYIQQLENHIGELTEKVAQPKWISVKEREPKRLQRALIYSPVGNRIASGVYTEVGFITQAAIGEITHWMKVPEPPKEDT